ncbi:hypothetical protein FQZ97_980040 [compost metagenome]
MQLSLPNSLYSEVLVQLRDFDPSALVVQSSHCASSNFTAGVVIGGFVGGWSKMLPGAGLPVVQEIPLALYLNAQTMLLEAPPAKSRLHVPSIGCSKA